MKSDDPKSDDPKILFAIFWADTKKVLPWYLMWAHATIKAIAHYAYDHGYFDASRRGE